MKINISKNQLVGVCYNSKIKSLDELYLVEIGNEKIALCKTCLNDLFKELKKVLEGE